VSVLRWSALTTFGLGVVALVLLFLPSCTTVVIPEGVSSANPGMVERGAYLVRAAGCVSCHWDKKGGGEPFAGGRALATPFGTFHGPNITPDDAHGIGKFTDADFVRALTHGETPDGANLYPTFPYTTYTHVKVEDAVAIKAYLDSLPPSAKENIPHDVPFPFSIRPLLKGWKFLFFRGGDPLADDPAQDSAWNRGRYLTEALGHCTECHSPRGTFGQIDVANHLRGNPAGPEGWKVPALVGAGAKLADWSVEEVAEYLKSGSKPDFDSAQGPMAEVIEDGTKHLTDEDRAAMALYLKSFSR
jgi:mono/diheme cytochrome c family protein